MRKLLLHRAPARHFTEEQRIILGRLWNSNAVKGRDTRLSIRAFAKANAVPYATPRRELLRGMDGKPLPGRNKGGWFYPGYSAAKAQDNAADKNARKGAGQRFTNKHAEAFRHQIVVLGKSPAHARHDILAAGLADVPSVSPVHCHTGHGDTGVLRGQTPCHPSGRRKKKRPARRSRKCPANRSSDGRPPEADARAEPGPGRWAPSSPAPAAGAACPCRSTA